MNKLLVLVMLAVLSTTTYKVAAAPTANQEPAPVKVAPGSRPVLEKIKISGRKAMDTLRLRVIMRFPANVGTIQQATQYLLETTDYKLVLNPNAVDDSRHILSRALLPQDRDESFKTVEAALLQIAGDDTVLVIDRANKLISFEFLEDEAE